MNSARKGYAASVGPTRSTKAAEYETIARVTFRLKQCAKKKREHFSKFAEALHENRRLWTLLAVDIANPKNELPTDLKGNILSLADFTFQYTGRVLSEDVSVRPLLEINMMVLTGLKNGGAIR